MDSIIWSTIGWKKIKQNGYHLRRKKPKLLKLLNKGLPKFPFSATKKKYFLHEGMALIIGNFVVENESMKWEATLLSYGTWLAVHELPICNTVLVATLLGYLHGKQICLGTVLSTENQLFLWVSVAWDALSRKQAISGSTILVNSSNLTLIDIWIGTYTTISWSNYMIIFPFKKNIW